MKYLDITCGQYEQHAGREVTELELVSIYTGLSKEDISKMPKRDFDAKVQEILLVLDRDEKYFLKTFDVNGVTYGFIPDWGKFSLDEWADISEYAKELEGNISKVMSILYRPVTKRNGEAYEIEPYQGTNDSLKDAPLAYFNGAMLFFWSINRELLSGSLRSLAGKVTSSRRSGVSIPFSQLWRRMTSYDSKRLENYR